MKPSEVVKKLRETNSRLEKEKIIQEAWDSGCIDFFTGMKLTFDSLITFGVKQIEETDFDEGTAHAKTNYSQFLELAKKLQNRELTGHVARNAIEDFRKETNQDEWNYFYRLILLKDLDAGTSETTINKVLKKIGGKALEYVIPVFTCQLAFDCEGREVKIDNKKLYLEPKLDGVRILAACDKKTNTVTLYTRNGKENTNFPNVVSLLEHYTKDYFTESYMLDGEVMSDDFQALMKQLNRKKDVKTSNSVYNIFDIVPLEDFSKGFCKLTQSERKKILWDYVLNSSIATPHTAVNVIMHESVDLSLEKDRKRFEEYKKAALEKGYEGIMIKDPEAPYEGKRSTAWMKYKPVITVDLIVKEISTGLIPVSTKVNGKNLMVDELMMNTLHCEGEYEGKKVVCSIGSGYSIEQRREIFKNSDKIIGQMIEVECDVLTQNSGTTDTWSLRFPRFLRFRDDK